MADEPLPNIGSAFAFEAGPLPEQKVANKFDFAAHLKSQGRGVMEMLQAAAKVHPNVDRRTGKVRTCTLHRTVDGKRETLRLNAPWCQVFNGVRCWHEIETITHYMQMNPPWLPDDALLATLRDAETEPGKRVELLEAEVRDLKALILQRLMNVESAE